MLIEMSVCCKYPSCTLQLKKLCLLFEHFAPVNRRLPFTDFAPHASPCCTDYMLSQTEFLGSSKSELSGWQKLPNRPWTALKKIFRCWRSIAPKTIEQISLVSRGWILEMSPNDASSPRACWLSNPCSRQSPAIDMFALFSTRISMLICRRIFPGQGGRVSFCTEIY